MLLSMFISLLLARKLRGVTYVLLTTVALLYISLLSFGLPTLGPYNPTPDLIPFPLSFPFYSINTVRPRSFWTFTEMAESYELYFMTSRIAEVWEERSHFQFNYLEDLFPFYCYFLLINIVGAILGYGLSKSKSIWRYFGRRKSETHYLMS